MPLPKEKKKKRKGLSKKARRKRKAEKEAAEAAAILAAEEEAKAAEAERQRVEAAARVRAMKRPPWVPGQRRCFAEDPNWMKPRVRSLVLICLDAIVNHFPSIALLDDIPSQYRSLVIDALPLDMNLDDVARHVPDEGYWKRRAQSSWGSFCDVSQYEGWRSLFFERMLKESLEGWRAPTKTVLDTEIEEKDALGKEAMIARSMAQHIGWRRGQGPPARDHLDDDVVVGDQEEAESTEKVMHLIQVAFPFIKRLHLTAFPSHLSPALWMDKMRLEDVSIAYGVRGVGVNFRWKMFGIRMDDCLGLAHVLESPSCTLKKLALPTSSVNDELVRPLCAALMKNTSIVCLDLSHNKIGDRGARALAKVVAHNQYLHTLLLSDNAIHAHGGIVLGKALAKTGMLRTLNIRLNRLEEQGGKALFAGMDENRSITSLNVGGNGLGASSAEALAQCIRSHPILRELDMSCNTLGGPRYGAMLLDAFKASHSLVDVDLRLCEFGEEVIRAFQTEVDRRKERVRKRTSG